MLAQIDSIFMIVLFLLLFLLSYISASIAAALVAGSNDVGLLHLVAATLAVSLFEVRRRQNTIKRGVSEQPFFRSRAKQINHIRRSWASCLVACPAPKPIVLSAQFLPLALSTQAFTRNLIVFESIRFFSARFGDAFVIASAGLSLPLIHRTSLV